MKMPVTNSNRHTILSHMSRDIRVSSRELFKQLTDGANHLVIDKDVEDKEKSALDWEAANNKLPRMRIYSYQSFLVTMASLKKDGWFEVTKSPHKPEKLQYRLAAGVVVTRQPKKEVSIRQAIYSLRQDQKQQPAKAFL